MFNKVKFNVLIYEHRYNARRISNFEIYFGEPEYEGGSKSFRTESITKYTFKTINTR